MKLALIPFTSFKQGIIGTKKSFTSHTIPKQRLLNPFMDKINIIRDWFFLKAMRKSSGGNSLKPFLFLLLKTDRRPLNHSKNKPNLMPFTTEKANQSEELSRKNKKRQINFNKVRISHRRNFKYREKINKRRKARFQRRKIRKCQQKVTKK